MNQFHTTTKNKQTKKPGKKKWKEMSTLLSSCPSFHLLIPSARLCISFLLYSNEVRIRCHLSGRLQKDSKQVSTICNIKGPHSEEATQQHNISHQEHPSHGLMPCIPSGTLHTEWHSGSRSKQNHNDLFGDFWVFVFSEKGQSKWK